MAGALLVEKGCHAVESFSTYPVIAAFSDKTFNMRFAEDLSPFKDDRSVFSQRVGFPFEDLVCMEQIHGSNIVLVNASMKGRGSERRADALLNTDGAITRERGIPIGVLTADCGSVFFYDPKKHVIGIAHIGWRGMLNGLPQKMIAAFSGNFLSRPEDLRVAFGPMIRRCCYEVGEEVASHFGPFMEERGGKKYFDLAAAIKSSLQENGVKKSSTEDPGLCTFCKSERFYSYRREGESSGRMMSVVMLR